MNKGQRTKLNIIEKSSTLFNQHGYKSTSLSDIMAVTGLKKGGIYNHFEDKDTLAKASFVYSMNTLGDHYKEAIASKETAQEQLLAFISVFSTLFHDHIVIGGCPLMNAAIEADDTDIEFKDVIKVGFTGLLRIIEGILQIGKERSEIQEELEIESAAIFILSSLEGALALSRLYKDQRYLEMTISQLKGLLFK
ncbi:TetR/AcrR family transcriptional regulator [Planococcus sp. N028]|uniref:TetR/AcrR family transcriptional regulator n=1 Tax=Planococcus shixiaomingii TaxID=3058393 RepID=A0ABT8MYT5_9BACL|nr:TetR/AcrR family transcriptional regulator [Planococcus sp. N028]MDN7240622.1 TetR/AcrR family transcriptional regulator [Planococcus sp. N028]